MTEPTPPAAPSDDPGRRFLTLLFADLSRSTELAHAMEAEHYAALLAELRTAYSTTIGVHGGMVVRVQGDGLLAMFGHPVTREDDSRRALDAALALHAHVRELALPVPAGMSLRLHSGLHGGMVLVRSGDIERGRFELSGKVPNVAARLSESAGADEILISVETLGPARRHFDTDEPFSMKVRGLEEPLAVVKVRPRASQARQAVAPSGTQREFVGREAELRALLDCLAVAGGGQPRTVAVAGPPGLGKTRLVLELIVRATQEGWRVLRAYCDDNQGAEPMQPFAQLLREFDVPVLPKSAQAVASVKALLLEQAAQQPVLLFVDDWQWADDASHQVLQALRHVTGCRLLVVLTTRQLQLPQALEVAQQTVLLAPLQPGQALQLAAAQLGAVDPFVVAQVCQHAGGNPLFIGELCHSVTSAGLRDAALVEPSDAAGAPGPKRLHGSAGWLNHLVESRVQALPLAQAELLRAAAVVGNVVPGWLLEHLSGEGLQSPLLQALAEQDFLFPGERADTLRFKHGLTRDVIYASVGLHSRQMLHLRIAAALLHRQATQAQTDTLEALAYHFEAGGDSALAAHYAEASGDRALAASALDRARVHYRGALSALEQLSLSPERARRWVAIVQRLGMVAVYDPTRADLALVRRALALAEEHGDAAATARSRYWLSYIHYGLGEAPAAVLHGQRALDEARAAGDEPLAVQIVATLGEAHVAAGQYDQAMVLLDQAIEVKRRHRSGRRTNVGLAFSLVCRACVLGDKGLFVQAEETFSEALACVVDEEHQIGATIHGWRAAVLLWQGRWAEALAASNESGRIAHATRSLAQYSIARAMGGYAAWMQGRRPEDMQVIEDATAWLAPRETGIFRSLNHGWLTEGLMALGRRADARQFAAQAVRRARQSDRLGLAMSQRALALDEAEQGRMGLALRHLRSAQAAAEARDSAHERAVNQCCEARLLLLSGQRGPARALLDAAALSFDRLAMPWHLAQAQAQAQALITSHDDGVRISSTGEPVGRSVPAPSRPPIMASITPTAMP